MKSPPLFRFIFQMQTKNILLLAVFVFLLKITAIYFCFAILSYPAIMHNIVVSGAYFDAAEDGGAVVIPYENYMRVSPSIPLVPGKDITLRWSKNKNGECIGVIQKIDKEGIIISVKSHKSDLMTISPEVPIHLFYRYQKRNIIQRSINKILWSQN